MCLFADVPVIRNDKLNYYKFGLGLGTAVAPATTSKGKILKDAASEAATGGADQ